MVVEMAMKRFRIIWPDSSECLVDRIDSGPISFFRYGERYFVGGLFKMHDTHGVPLWLSLCECMKRGWEPCLGQFRCDAFMAGWTWDRADTVIGDACEFSGYERRR